MGAPKYLIDVRAVGAIESPLGALQLQLHTWRVPRKRGEIDRGDRLEGRVVLVEQQISVRCGAMDVHLASIGDAAATQRLIHNARAALFEVQRARGEVS